MAEPTFVAPAELFTTPRWALPTVFRTQVTTGAMRPLLKERDEVEVRRRPPQVGDVVVLVVRAGVLFRRVIDVREHQVLVAADLAPAPDGWVPRTALVGVLTRPLRPRGRLLTAVFRQALTQGAHLRDGLRRARQPREPAPSANVQLRRLDPTDAEDQAAFKALRDDVYPGLAGDTLPDDPALPVIGAFLDGRLAGHQNLIPTGPGAVRGPVAVATWARGRGLGSLLVREAVKQAPVWCDARYFWELIHVRNVPSIRSFVGAGFTIVDRPQLTSVFRADHGEYPVLTVDRSLP